MTGPVSPPGEWEGTLFQRPEQAQQLLVKLAIHHGNMIAPLIACPLCCSQKYPSAKYFGAIAMRGPDNGL